MLEEKVLVTGEEPKQKVWLHLDNDRLLRSVKHGSKVVAFGTGEAIQRWGLSAVPLSSIGDSYHDLLFIRRFMARSRSKHCPKW